jgi:hypothetical protein
VESLDGHDDMEQIAAGGNSPERAFELGWASIAPNETDRCQKRHQRRVGKILPRPGVMTRVVSGHESKVIVRRNMRQKVHILIRFDCIAG